MQKNNKLAISSAILVEGKYDKIKLESITDALIVALDGYMIYSDAEKIQYIRKLAAERGVIILTDSDSAGFALRGYLSGLLPAKQVRQAYIPDVPGKEKRKKTPSKEGKLGVEGIGGDLLREALLPFCDGFAADFDTLTPADMFSLGLSGGPGSAAKRRALTKTMSLPENISSSALIKYVNSSIGKNAFMEIVKMCDFESDA